MVSTVSAIGLAGCSSGGGSCGPAETNVEELNNQDPTGIVEDVGEKVSIIGTVEDVADMSGEYIVVDDTTGLAEFRAGPGFTFNTQNIPENDECISGWGFHVTNDSDRADVVLSDVVIDREN